MRRAIIGHFDLCTGCRVCELACSAIKYGTYAPRKALLTVSTAYGGLMNRPVVCEQCENAFCMRACPTGAIVREPKTNAVIVIPEKCNGCGLCTKACPIGAVKIDLGTGKAVKCDLCNGDPACVRHCPTNAIVLK